MPPQLRKAHRQLDDAVDKLYRSAAFTGDRDRAEHLFRALRKARCPSGCRSFPADPTTKEKNIGARTQHRTIPCIPIRVVWHRAAGRLKASETRLATDGTERRIQPRRRSWPVGCIFDIVANGNKVHSLYAFLPTNQAHCCFEKSAYCNQQLFDIIDAVRERIPPLRHRATDRIHRAMETSVPGPW